MIETERLLLRPPEERDVDALHRIVTDPEVMRWLDPNCTPGTYDDALGRVETYRRSWELDGFGHFMIVPRGAAEAVGRVGILCWQSDFSDHGTRAEIGDDAEIEIGWTLEHAAWGNGYATEAAAAIRDWTLREVAPRRLISLIHADNVRSQRVAEKIGEGYRHDVVSHGDLTVGLWQL